MEESPSRKAPRLNFDLYENDGESAGIDADLFHDAKWDAIERAMDDLKYLLWLEEAGEIRRGRR